MNDFHDDELITRLERLGTVAPTPDATRSALERVRRAIIDAPTESLRAETQTMLNHFAATLSEKPPAEPVPQIANFRRRTVWLMGTAAAIVIGMLSWYANVRYNDPYNEQAGRNRPLATFVFALDGGLAPRPRPAAEPVQPLAVGATLVTKPGERRRVTLIDGSVLYVNQNTEVTQVGARHVDLRRGEVYVEVRGADFQSARLYSGPIENRPHESTFLVTTPQREVAALGTHFAVQADPHDTGVLVTQGKVKVSGMKDPIEAGQQLTPGSQSIVPAPRVSCLLDWTRELMAAANSPLVPANKRAGGDLVALDPAGQEVQLTLRKYLIDVHIEDGFARTTIDQTYFNNQYGRLEGTFYFPLPADATLSRLAMYVENGNVCELKEGGMVERDHARNVYEEIRYARRDPALLEWVDGSTFKMRVFPLEGRKEKRIILSYTQRLPELYGTAQYRFPGGHNMESVSDWNFHAVIKGKQKMTSGSHPAMTFDVRGDDVIAQAADKNIKPNRDVTLEIARGADFQSARTSGPIENRPHQARFAQFTHEGNQYLMLRYRPELLAVSRNDKQRRDWVILFESAANRDPLLARAQIDVVRTLLENAEHDDTFSILTAGTRVRLFENAPCPATAANVDRAIKFLDQTHLIGALDLEHALQTAAPILARSKNPHLVHVGAGSAAMGERREDALVKLIPANVCFVGVGVGKRWSRSFMKQAAERTGGLFTQINPDEPIAWRTFELLATLNTPRLQELAVAGVDPRNDKQFLTETTSISQGEELCAITRIDKSGTLPTVLIVRGKIAGQPFVEEIPVKDVAANAGYLPRQWAKLEIDRLLAEDAAKNKPAIIALSKASYVMSPFTSLLVLETDQDYTKYNVDRGRKDHWALYECPATIPNVYEPDVNVASPEPKVREDRRTPQQVMETILVRTPPRMMTNERYFSGVGAYSLQEAIALALNGTGVVGRNFVGFTGGPLANQSDSYRVLAYNVPAAFANIDQSEARFDAVWQAQNNLVNVADVNINYSGGTGYVVSDVLPVTNGTGYQIGDVLSMQGGTVAPGGEPAKLQVTAVNNGAITGASVAINGTYTSVPTGNVSAIGGSGYGATFNLTAPTVTSITSNSIATSGGTTVALTGTAFTGAASVTFSAPAVQVTTTSDPIYQGMRIAPSPAQLWAYYEKNRAPFAVALVPNNVDDAKWKREFNDEFERLLSSRFAMIRLANRDVSNPLKIGSLEFALLANEIDDREAEENALRQIRGWDKAFSLLYQRPTFTTDQQLFYDLPMYAPGLSSSTSDILGKLEAESTLGHDIVTGSIDPAAKALIDRARLQDWSCVTLGDKKAAFRLYVNGAGQYAFKRTLACGLKEEVYCDGTTLVHLYPEIGLGSRRTVTRFHRADLVRAVPALVLPAEDLARGADVKLIDERTVAIVAHTPRVRSTSPWGLEVHLLFNTDGRLCERRLVEMPAKKIVQRETYDNKGTTAADAPDLKPDVSQLVIVPMPQLWYAYVAAGIKGWDGKSFANLDADQAIALIAAGCQQMNTWGLEPFEKRFQANGDNRPGFYTLLRSGLNHNLKVTENPTDPLTVYAARINKSERLLPLPGPKDGFLAKLAEFHDQYLFWRADASSSLQDRTAERDRALVYLKTQPDPLHAWMMIEALTQRGMGFGPEFQQQADDVYRRLGEQPGLAYLSRYERARLQSASGKHDEAWQSFRELYAETARAGRLPPIDGLLASDARFAGLVRDTSATWLKDKRYHLSLLLGCQLAQLGQPALADEIVDATLAAAPKDGGNVDALALRLSILEYLCQRAHGTVTVAVAGAVAKPASPWDKPDALLQELLDNETLARQPALWRLGARIASNRGLTRRALMCQEVALDLEFDNLPATVNLQTIRQDYGDLLRRYEELARTHPEPAEKLVTRVVRAADRWRSLDPEVTAVCQQTAKILRIVGADELAWDYLTTPIGMKPNESAPWLSLAESLGKGGDFDLADRAYEQAFAAEPTNAQILWDRARNLENLHRDDDARLLYRQLAEGTWQPRFLGVQMQARLRLQMK